MPEISKSVAWAKFPREFDVQTGDRDRVWIVPTSTHDRNY